MNEAIVLLPLLVEAREKMAILQAATTLLDSFGAYDEALEYADRIYSLRGDKGESLAACLGLANKVELNFLRGNRPLAQSSIAQATSPSGFSFAMTASFGIATRSAQDKSGYEDTLVAADKALYLSKNEGRNRVTVYHPSAAAHPSE